MKPEGEMMSERMTHDTEAVRRGTDRTQQVQGLLDLAGELQGLLLPVKPAAVARRRLHDELVAEARRRYPGRGARLFQQYRRMILIVAAAIGSLASIVGVIVAVTQRNRHARSTHAA